MDFFSRYAEYAPILIAAAVSLICAVIYFFAGQRALAERRGEKDWVRQYGKAGLCLSDAGLTAKKIDWLCGFAVAVYAALAFLGHTLLLSKAMSGLWLDNLMTLHSLLALILTVAGSLALWLLLQHLYNSSLISVCGALLFATVFAGAHYGLCLLSISLFFLQRWAVRDTAKRLFPGELLLYAAYLFLGFAAASVPQLLWFVPGYIILHLCRTICRFRADRKTGSMVTSLLLAAVAWVISAVGMFVWLMMLLKLYQPADFPMLLFSERFYALAYSMLPQVVKCLIRLPSRSFFIVALTDAPVLLFGVAGMVTALQAAVRRRDARAMIVLWVGGIAVLIFALTGAYVMTLPMIIAIGYLWKNFEGAQRKLPIILYTVLVIVAFFALYAAAAYLPLSREIIQRIY